MCALVGESGSGKSTAVQLLLRYYDVGGGRISVDGTDVRGWDVTALRGSIGLVSQEPALFTGSIYFRFSSTLRYLHVHGSRASNAVAI